MKIRKKKKAFEKKTRKIHFHCILFCVEFYIWRLLLPFTWCSMYNQKKKIHVELNSMTNKNNSHDAMKTCGFLFILIFFLSIFKLNGNVLFGAAHCVMKFMLFSFSFYSYCDAGPGSVLNCQTRKKEQMFNVRSTVPKMSVQLLNASNSISTLIDHHISRIIIKKHRNNKLSLSFSFGQNGVHQHITMMIFWALFLYV